VAAAAAALLEKCALLSADHLPDARLALARAHALRMRAEELVEEDLRAYLDYVDALRSVRGLESTERAAVLAPNLARTIEVPLEITRQASGVAALAEEIATGGNPNLRTDAVVAAVLAGAAAKATAVLVESNLGRRARDARLAEARRLSRSVSARIRRLTSPAR
jgi:formiminotetrahydrofolate cyclodeaminase